MLLYFSAVILATGTFDILHPGHLLYLSKAKSLGDELYVIVARDSMIKHKPKPVIPEAQRLAMVKGPCNVLLFPKQVE